MHLVYCAATIALNDEFCLLLKAEKVSVNRRGLLLGMPLKIHLAAVKAVQGQLRPFVLLPH